MLSTSFFKIITLSTSKFTTNSGLCVINRTCFDSDISLKIVISCVKNYIKNNILKIENVILLDNDDISTGNSPGKNALIYLDVFSKDSTIKFYMVDQPGDDVSQNKI